MNHVQQSSLTSSIHKGIKGQERSEGLKEKLIEDDPQVQDLNVLQDPYSSQENRIITRGCSTPMIMIFGVILTQCFLIDCGEASPREGSALGDQSTPTSQETQKQCAQGEVLLTLKSEEYGAELWIDGERVGRIPLPQQCLSSGLHLFTLKRSSFSAKGTQTKHYRRLFWIPLGDQVELKLSGLIWEGDTESPLSRSLISDGSVEGFKNENVSFLSTQKNRSRLELTSVASSELLYLNTRHHVSRAHHSNLVNANRLKIDPNRSEEKVDDSSKRRVALTLDILSFQDLIDDALPVHPLSPWGSEEARLRVRTLSLSVRLGSDREWEGVQLSAGRFAVNETITPQSRKWSIDGLKALTKVSRGLWLLEVKLSAGAESSAQIEDQVEATEKELWIKSDLSLTHRMAHGGLSWNLAHLESMTKTNGDSSRLFITSLSLSKDELRSSVGASLTERSELSIFESDLVFKGFLDGTFGLKYHAGDRWDQRWSFGEVNPLVYTKPNLSVLTQFGWNSLHFVAEHMRGHAPRWSLAPNSEFESGQSIKLQLHWGSRLSRPMAHLIELTPQTKTPPYLKEPKVGLILGFTQYLMDDVGSRWSLAPWASISSRGPRQMTVMSAGWSFALDRNRRPRVILRGLMSSALGSQKLSSILSRPLEEGYIWPEVELSWSYERVKLDGYCGYPLEQYGLVAPNLWRASCGLRFGLSAPLEF